MDSYTLFGINRKKLSENPKLVSAVIGNIDSSLGHCCVADKNQVENPEDEIIRVFLPFSDRTFGGNNHKQIIKKANLLAVRDECWIDTHQILTIDSFDFEKFDSIRHTIETRNSLTLIIDEEKEIDRFVHCSYEMFNSFKFLVRCLSTDGMMSSGQSSSLALSFLNMKDCVPIINPRKVDGLGVSIILFDREQTKERGELSYRSKLNLILSNYQDNVVIVDGIKVESRSLTKPDRMSALLSEKTLMALLSSSKKSKKKENDYVDLLDKENNIIKSNNGLYYTISTSTSSSSSSTTSGWG